jgi:hypothetical protein
MAWSTSEALMEVNQPIGPPTCEPVPVDTQLTGEPETIVAASSQV